MSARFMDTHVYIKLLLFFLRTMSMPPPAVKLALESVCVLLGESVTDWKSIRSAFMKVRLF